MYYIYHKITITVNMNVMEFEKFWRDSLSDDGGKV